MHGDLYTLAKSYQQEQLRQASEERSWRRGVFGRRSSFNKLAISIANFLAAFF